MKPSRNDMTKQEMREETERLVREAMERKAVTIKQGETRIDATCGKCGARNRVTSARGQTRVPFTCKECGHQQTTL
jgi:predicted RNA-binding Zn-ribbon protein involved in translation (DUF1610 family)